MPAILKTDKVYSSSATKDYEKNNYNIDLVEPHENQKTILRDNTRFRVAATGRRFGKSELSKIACVMRLTRGQNIWHCSPTNQNAKRMFREFIKLFKNFPETLVTINKTNMRIDLHWNDAFIEFKSLHDSDNLRGEGLDFIVIDEAAFVSDHVWNEVLEPMLLGRADGKKGDALFISSTNGRNWFWRMFQLGLDESELEYKSFHFTSYDNPLIDNADIDSIKKRVPEYVFDREYMAVFEESGGSVFKNLDPVLRNWEGKTTLEEYLPDYGTKLLKREVPYQESDYVFDMLEKRDKTIVFGIDWGQVNDYTVITVFDIETQSLIEYVKINQTLWEDIRSVIVELYDKWQPIYILAEENNATANIETLEKEGLPIGGLYMTSKVKPKVINQLAVAIQEKEISLPNDKQLVGELSAFEMTQTTAGNIKYGAPSGLHDDIVMSLAICYECARDVLLPEAYEIISI